MSQSASHLLEESDEESDIENMLKRPPTFSQSPSHSHEASPSPKQESTAETEREESVEEKGESFLESLEWCWDLRGCETLVTVHVAGC